MTNSNIEIARKEKLFNRWNILRNRDGGVPAFYETVKDIPNAQLYMVNLINDFSRATEAEELLNKLEKKESEIISEIASNEYKRKRLLEYPDIGDQLDSIYKIFKKMKESGIDMGVDGDNWINKISNIKTSNPK